MERLKRRSDFLKASRAAKYAARGVVLQARRRKDGNPSRIGFTVTKKIGNAPRRNRVKRRLREAARLVMPDRACAGFDYVLIGRQETLRRDFNALKDDLATALAKVHKAAGNTDGAETARRN